MKSEVGEPPPVTTATVGDVIKYLKQVSAAIFEENQSCVALDKVNK